MPKYRKRPVVVEAEVYRHGMEDGFDLHYDKKLGGIRITPYIETLGDGREYIREGDYIIISTEGERRTCRPDIFIMTYELVK